MKYCFYLSVLIAGVLFSGTEHAIGQEFMRSDTVEKILESDKADSVKISLLLNKARALDGQPLDGLVLAREALALAEQNNNTSKKALALEYIGLFHRKMGNYPEAVEASFEAMRIYEAMGNQNDLVAMQLQIGSHFAEDKNFSSAISYIGKALNTFREQRDTMGMVLALINLGESYRMREDLDSAATCFNECIALNRSLNQDMVEGYAVGNLGMVYFQQGKLPEAVEALNSSIELLSKLNDFSSVSVYQAELAKVWIQMGQKEKGRELLKASLEMARRENLKKQIRDINKDLANFYEAEGRYKRALGHRKQYEIYQDSLVNIDNVREVEQLESKYWLDLKEADIRLLEQANQTKRNILIMLSVGTVILLTLLFLLYRLQLSRKRAFVKVSEQKTIIEKREQEKALLLRELNHRVKNNLQMVSSMFSLQSGQLRGTPAAEALTAARRRIDALMLIHQKLYRENVDAKIALSDYIKELVDSLVYSFNKKVNLQFDLDPVSFHLDSAIPLGIVVNELITNSLKYAGDVEEVALNLKVKQNNGNVSVVIGDNGPGLPDDFDFQKTSSLGLKLVHSLVKQLHGDITQTNDNGCRWEIVLRNKQ